MESLNGMNKPKKHKRDVPATKEQLELSEYIKAVHKKLREETKTLGDLAWERHLSKDADLSKYAESMRALSESFWNKNKDSSQNRIDWTVNVCHEYFNQKLLYQREREIEILKKALVDQNQTVHKPIPSFRQESKDRKLRLLDVGSCFNPFQSYTEFDVTAIDIAPSQDRNVYKADFIHIPTSDTTSLDENIQDNRLLSLPNKYFDCVVFSLLLEYFPTSHQRLICISKAYKILDSEGILVIITPDSKHQGSNAKLMKNWRYILAKQGFSRIKIEKLQHITCMVFRKSIHLDVTLRWAQKYKEAYMVEELNIPQDLQNFEENEFKL